MAKAKRQSVVMVFGVFDRLHPGHREFLRQARQQGDKLIVVVARDNFVESFKKKAPQWNQEKRLEEIQKVSQVDDAVLADEVMGTYEVVRGYTPDVIVLGHDQDILKADLEKRMRAGTISQIPIIRLQKFNFDAKSSKN